MSTETRPDTVERLALVAHVLVVHQLPPVETDTERELLLVHALVKAYFEGMDASMAILNDAITKLTAKGST